MQVSGIPITHPLLELPGLMQGKHDRLRRVKCDEGRPSCRRCTLAGRECRGYQPAPVGSFSWQQLLHWRQPCLSVDAAEARCLSYYQHVVAPSLARSLDHTFWGIHVPRVLDQEPAARHAVLAISALHEDFDTTLLKRASGRLDDLTSLTGRLELNTDISSRCAFALQHYNSAIRMVLEDRISNVETLLTISLLFTCIELLQGSTDAAVKHCQHGSRVHNDRRLPSELSAAFNQISIFPQLFDTFDTSNVPKLTFPQGEHCPVAVGEMRTAVQARHALDATMARGARLLRLAAINREGGASCSLQDLKTEQFLVQRALGLWWESFAALRRLSSTYSAVHSDAAAIRLLETRWLVSSILADSCLADTENVFDEYLDKFQRIVELAEQEEAARSASGFHLPSFSFDMGYSPLLYIVGIKCRQLRLRARALILMKDLSCAREVIWDTCIMYATVKWAIEIEHGLSLDEERMRSTTDPYSDEQLSWDAKRIVGFVNTDKVSLGVDSEGCAVVRRRIRFHSSGPDGVVGPLWDHTTMRL